MSRFLASVLLVLVWAVTTAQAQTPLPDLYLANLQISNGGGTPICGIDVLLTVRNNTPTASGPFFWGVSVQHSASKWADTYGGRVDGLAAGASTVIAQRDIGVGQGWFVVQAGVDVTGIVVERSENNNTLGRGDYCAKAR
jgi:hypothetical protein